MEVSPCTWNVKHTEKDPHIHAKSVKTPAICDTILNQIGNTPLVRLNRIPQSEGIKAEVLVKCDFFNAGGSVKDRIAKRMIEEAEKSGVLKPAIIEPTSGNTGIGLALAAAVKGYRAIITMPEKMSQEKVDVLRALGAEIVRTPTEAAFDAPESHIGVAKKLNSEIPNSVILDQYANPYNPIAHYDTTAEEILAACDGKIDMFVAGAGTGGIVVGIDPHGSILAQPESLNTTSASYKVEGIGYDFIPRVLDRSVVDEWLKSSDLESFTYSRRMIREEGILCGGSSGSAMWGAMIAAKRLKPGQRCVVLLADSVRNYMTKFLNDQWMIDNGFLESKVTSPRNQKPIFNFGNYKVKDLHLPQAVVVTDSTSCLEATTLMQEKNFDQVPVVSSQTQKNIGLVTLGNILSKINRGVATPSTSVKEVMFKFDKKKKFTEIKDNTLLSDLSGFLEINSAAVVTSDNMKVKHVVTKVDLVSFMMKLAQEEKPKSPKKARKE